MSAADDRPILRNLGTVMGAPENGLRYMRRRRVGTADRNGDPLDGLVNLFYVGIVLAVGLLVTALTAAGLSGLLTNENMTIVTNPGTPEMQVIVKEGGTITKLDTQPGGEVEGVGTLLGSFYRLASGTIVFVPSGQTAPTDAMPLPAATATPGATPTPGVTGYPTPTPYPTTTGVPTPYPTTLPPTPTPGVTLTPDAGIAPRGTP